MGTHVKSDRPGRKEKFSARDQQQMSRLISTKRKMPKAEILGLFNAQNENTVGERTFHQYCRKMGLNRRRVIGKKQVLGFSGSKCRDTFL